MESSTSSILHTLRNFKPVQKPKLTHIPVTNNDSSPDSSPVRRRRDVIVNLDSESEDEIINCDNSEEENDCVITHTDAEHVKTSPKKEEPTKTSHKSNVIFIDSDSDCEKNGKVSETTPANETKSEAVVATLNTASNVEANASGQNSGDEALKPIKRKRKSLANSPNKRRKRYSDSEEQFTPQKRVYESDEDEEQDTFLKKVLRERVVDLLDNGAEKDLNDVPNMNSKKSDVIFANRPYSSWENTLAKFESTKGLSASMLNAICDTIVAKEIVSNLMTKCEKTACRTEKKITSAGTLVTESPALLNPEMKLSSYQLVGLNWLVLMRSSSLNSILADEMGLGKTIQVIAFLAYLKETGLVVEGHPHLVIVPSSTLDNWYNEFQKWCPTLNVLIYHGDQASRRYLRHVWCAEGFGDADVILTTYSCATSCYAEKKMFRNKEFNYIVFDEAHMLKNMNTQRYDALIQFNGNFKILLTGTPLQNNLLELMSLLVFLMPHLFRSKLRYIKLLFSKCTKTIDEDSSAFEKERVNQAKRIIEPFMLRRLKEDVLRDLPEKTVVIERCPLTPKQKEKYNEIMEEFKVDTISKDPNCYMVYFMMLRKMANHPLLLRYYFTEEMLEKIAERLAKDCDYKGTNTQYIQEDLRFKSDYELFCLCQDYDTLHDLEYTIPNELFLSSGKLKSLLPMLSSLKDAGHRVLIFSQFILMLDILEVFCEINNFNFLRLDGSTQTVDRQDLINQYNADNEIFIFLLSTKAGGVGINLTAADTVIIHDIDFNPYNDKQAEDRCHRVGQTKPVRVIKLISEDTIEEGIHSTATKKLYLEREITAGNNANEKSVSKTIVQLLNETLGITDSVKNQSSILIDC